MILAMVGLILAGPAIDIVVRPDATQATIVAVAPLASSAPRERAATEAMVEALLDGTRSYSKHELLEYGGLSGVPLACDVVGHHVRLQFAVPANDLKLGADLLREMLDHARLNDASVLEAVESLPYRSRSLWQTAIEAPTPEFGGIVTRDVWGAYRRVFRPERTTIAVVSPIAEEEVRPVIADALSDWAPARAQPPLVGGGTTPNRETAKVTELRLPAMQADADSLPKLLLLSSALAGGKGGALFRVAREGLGLSYTQDGGLWLSGGKGEIRLIIVSTPVLSKDAAEAARAALLDDVVRWGAEDWSRAVGYLKGSLGGRLDPSPLRWGSEYTVAGSALEAALSAAHWRSEVGSEWNPAVIVAAAEHVNLDALRAMAVEGLKAATIQQH